ncbi:Rep family protein [Staphylococcus hominis]|uniref:Rep family protein n=1 Tax=Staphylococcus hominis TaxID=1290 RepID=UPI002555B263|nr:Rep family protein [Staphylococcus hominis]MDK7930487.1 Rep family protein [Staphylococcus hominis]
MATLNRRCIEYSQQLDYLNFDSYEELLEHIKKSIDEHDVNYEYAAILHDKDIDDNGELSKPHVHVLFYDKNKLSKELLKEIVNDHAWNQFTYKDNKVQAMKYLIHDTSQSTEKYQYSVHDVTSNFDYVEFISRNQSYSRTVDNIITSIINGSITYTDLVKDDDLSLAYAKNRSRFDNALSIASERKAVAKDSKGVSVIWIHSDYSGIGKSYYARKKANEYIGDSKKSIYETSASNDLFQDYKGQEVVIIDDLKPQDIELSELLRLLDPNYTGSAKSRYNNKRITADLIIVTSILSPVALFSKMVSNFDIEPVDQLLRRITYVCKLDKVPNETTKAYLYVYRVEELEEPIEMEYPVVYGVSEKVRTFYGLKQTKKKR